MTLAPADPECPEVGAHRPAHLRAAESALDGSLEIGQRLLREMTGRYFTPLQVASPMLDQIADHIANWGAERISVCDPFAGDGRLAFWLIEEAVRRGVGASWQIHLWDIDTSALAGAKEHARAIASRHRISIKVDVREFDAFVHAPSFFQRFDVVVTNPPWETLKPDSRKLEHLGPEAADEYVRELRNYDAQVSDCYPHSRAARKFAGWGTNLARVGAELAVRLVRPGGLAGLVTPGSLLADETSEPLRTWLVGQCTLRHIAYYPAEARAFESADVAAVTLVLTAEYEREEVDASVSIYDKTFALREAGRVVLDQAFLVDNAYALPVSFGLASCSMLSDFSALPRFLDLESSEDNGLWAGRELDETRVADFLHTNGEPQFVRGRMIDRFEIREQPTFSVLKPGWDSPASVKYERIAWRDVSRHNQKRRVIATLIPPGWIAGNSLGVAYFRDGDARRLRWLLGVMSSLVFELQLRAVLATGHVSLGSVRKVHLPAYSATGSLDKRLVDLVERRLAGDETVEPMMEAVVARLYALDDSDMGEVVRQFPKLTALERERIVQQVGQVKPLEAETA